MDLLKKIFIRGCMGIAIFVAVLVLGALGYEQFNRVIASTRYTPEGEMKSVGDHRLHYVRKGMGGPTVVFESGLDFYGHLSWFKVENKIESLTTTISYDRAGILWSERGESPKTIQAVSNDLTNLLNSLDAPKPYIVVGHSAAGITLRQFIKDNQDDIAGIVLVDVSNPEQTLLRPPKVPPHVLFTLLSASGVMRLTANRPMPGTNSGDYINEAGAALIHRSAKATFDEAANMIEMSNSAQKIEQFGDIPLIVISATGLRDGANSNDEEVRQMIELKDRLQSELLDLSTNSVQITAEKSSHYVQLEEPELVVSAIESLISNYRGKVSLRSN